MKLEIHIQLVMFAILAGTALDIHASPDASAQAPATRFGRTRAAPFTEDGDGAFADTTAKPSGKAPTTQPDNTFSDSPELLLFKDLPVVVAAGKREQTQQQAAASVTVITADDIKLFGYRNLADVLRDQRSFYTSTDGLNSFAGVRGFLRPGEWNARILLTVDGRPTRESIYGQTHIDQDFVVPIEAIKQVEVVRGPGSALYGSGAVFGVINVVMKDGADVNGLQLKLDGGTKETGRASMLYGTKTADGWDLLTGFAAYSSQGDKDVIFDHVNDAAHNFGHIRNFDYEGADAGFIKLRKGDFTAQVDVETRQRDNRSATFLTSFTDPGSEHEERANVTLRVDHEVAPGQSFHAMVYYGHYLYKQQWTYAADPIAVIPAYRYTTTGQDDWVGTEVHYDWQVDPRLHLTFGADGMSSLFARQKDYDALNGVLLDIPSSTSTVGAFTEAEWKWTNWLTVIGGLRLDKVQSVSTNLSPRAGAIITPTKQDTVKLLYGRAFRAPNLYERYYSQAGYNIPNPGLKPEVIDTFEVVYERQFKSGWRTTLDGYLWKMSDALGNYTFPNGALQTRNSGDLWAHGLEAEISRQWDDGTRLRGFATYTRATSGGAILSHSPEWIVGGAAAIPVFNRRTFLAIEPQIVGAMKSDTGQYTQPTFLTNVVLTSKEIVKGLDGQIGVYGLFANHARLPRDGAFNQYQPTLDYATTLFMVSLTYRF